MFGLKHLRTRQARFRALTVLISLSIACALAELLSGLYLSGNPTLETWRMSLLTADESESVIYKRCIPQAYLLFVPSPTYRLGRNFHNSQGYRGIPVPMRRVPGTARVLCLGASTTYGWVEDPNDAYPAQLERWLFDLPPGVDRVEIINGGLPNATSAEILVHYQFKFQYFQPDLVIVNTGGNDAYSCAPGSADGKTPCFYQPDYSHARQPFAAPLPLSLTGRRLCQSRFMSLFVMKVFSQQPTINLSVERSDLDSPPPTVWHPAAIRRGLISAIKDEDLAFTRNLRRIIDMVQDDGSDVLLVPFRVAPGGQNYEYVELCRRNERIMCRLAKECGVPMAPFPHECISKENWVDSCHLNAAGCREKALHIGQYAFKLLNKRFGGQN